MKTIYKYILNVHNVQKIDVPLYGRALTVQLQENNPEKMLLWMEVEDTHPKELINIYIVGTGNEVPNDARTYINSVQMGYFVWHIYMDMWK